MWGRMDSFCDYEATYSALFLVGKELKVFFRSLLTLTSHLIAQPLEGLLGVLVAAAHTASFRQQAFQLALRLAQHIDPLLVLVEACSHGSVCVLGVRQDLVEFSGFGAEALCELCGRRPNPAFPELLPKPIIGGLLLIELSHRLKRGNRCSFENLTIELIRKGLGRLLRISKENQLERLMADQRLKDNTVES